MDVCGEGRAVTRRVLLELARQGGVEQAEAGEILERITDVAGGIQEIARAWPIRRATMKKIAACIEEARGRMRLDA